MLDLGWLDSVAYRGVTRVAVHTHPPKYGEPFIKEIIRNLIQGASKMIALVMDDLTDVNIFQDLLEASYKRLIPVYIILQHSSLDGFLHMCCSLQVRSISGLGLGLSSGQVRGDLAHKFIFVDGDKVVSGSYSYTWSYWRLHRCVVTMLTGQAVESFDTLFRELYADSAPVDLHVRLGIQKGFSHFQALPRASNSPPHSDHLKRKLYNPKYQLVISNRSSSTGELGPGGLELKPENSVLTRERRGSTLTRSKKETDDEEKRNQTIMDWLQRYDVKGLEEDRNFRLRRGREGIERE
uniref:Scaffolding anchor of CK1 domain-containing protein n=1 Tax=Callorhinchus milii TaxID=7868 RepID=A0A4W3IKT1_CALMI